MNNYDELKKLAKQVVEIAANKNQMFQLFGGVGLYKVETQNANRENTLAVGAIMNSLYELFMEKPELDLANKTYSGLKEIFETAGVAYVIDNGLKVLEYQLDSQANGKSPFNIDCRKLLETLKERLQTEKDLLQRVDFVKENFEQTLADHERYIEEHHGISMK